jgi:hypothetical protein
MVLSSWREMDKYISLMGEGGTRIIIRRILHVNPHILSVRHELHCPRMQAVIFVRIPAIHLHSWRRSLYITEI